nr:o-succinylbenzoate synthase [Actinomycetota bacterium]
MPDPGPATAWSELVATEPLALVGIEISLVELALVRPVRTAVGSHDRRPLALVRLVATGPDGEVEGWGECAALAEPGYAPEHAAGAFA